MSTMLSPGKPKSPVTDGQVSGGRENDPMCWPINEVKLRSLLRRRVPTDEIARQYGVSVSQVNQLCEEFGTCRETTE